MIFVRAGREEEMLAVHEEVLLNSGSSSLRSLLDPRWQGSTRHTIDWKHTDAETIRRVLTFLYLRDYHVPDPIRRRTPGDIDCAGPAGVQSEYLPYQGLSDIEDGADDIDYANDMNTDDDRRCDEGLLSPTLSSVMDDEEPITVSPARSGAIHRFKEQTFPFAHYSYIEILLIHAQVYRFAKAYHLTALQGLAVQRMTGLLANIDCTVPSAVDELADLAAYVYDAIEGGEDDVDRMQQLVSRFCALKYRFLFRGRFKALICQGGPFTRDVLKGVSIDLGQQRRMTTLRADAVDRLVCNLDTGLLTPNEILKFLQNDLDMCGFAR